MYYTYGGASTAGALPKWFRDNLTSLSSTDVTYAMLDERASKVEAGSKGLIVLPYFMGERSPIWDTNAKGTVIGLTLHHTQAHLYRAFLESVAYALRHIMETSEIDMNENTICTLVGGASRSTLWKQIFADVTGVPIRCSTQNVEAPIGDALLAGMGISEIEDYSEITNWVEFEQMIYPNTKKHDIYNDYYRLYKKVYLSLKEDMESISNLMKQHPQMLY
jgi:xylulokinase